jgi:uncharacterized cupredoxin-like copper-binding protein
VRVVRKSGTVHGPRAVALGALIAGGLVLVGCGGSVSSAGAAGSTGAAATSREAQVITVKASEFAFSDSTIKVPANQPVRLLLDNAGVIEHDLRVVNLPAKEVHQAPGAEHGEGHGHSGEVAAHATAGGKTWVEFTPTKKGRYAVECTIAGHKEAGMKGTLVVE